MKRELDEKLVNAFPLLYADRRADKRTTAMCWGFSCNDGWFNIIWDLSSKLEPLLQKFQDEYPDLESPPRASQVKEKFGGLRFYVTSGSDEMYDLIAEAEALSYKTCEDCGMPGKERGGGWIITRCDGCHEKKIMEATNKVANDHKSTFQKLAHDSPCLGCGCNPCDCNWGSEE